MMGNYLPSLRTLLHINVCLLLWYIALVVFVQRRQYTEIDRFRVDLKKVQDMLLDRPIVLGQPNTSAGPSPHGHSLPLSPANTSHGPAGNIAVTSPVHLTMPSNGTGVASKETGKAPVIESVASQSDNHRQFEPALGNNTLYAPKMQPPTPDSVTRPLVLPVTNITSLPQPASSSPAKQQDDSEMPNILSNRRKGRRKPFPKITAQGNGGKNTTVVVSADDVSSSLFKVNFTAELALAVEGAPGHYLPNHRNPCWRSKLPNPDPYLHVTFSAIKDQHKAFNHMRRHFQELALAQPEEAVTRLRCLPLVYLAGVTKSGTTDLYTKMEMHPQMYGAAIKEPNYWSARRLFASEATPTSDYINIYDYAAHLLTKQTAQDSDYRPGLIMDGSPNYLWNYDGWWKIPGNRGVEEPAFHLAHTFKKLIPNAKFIAILRDPSDRLYSQFRMWSGNHSAEVFHHLVVRSLTHFKTCLTQHSLRACVYTYARELEMKNSGYNALMQRRGMFLRASIYYPYVRDWLEVFPRDQFLVIKAEDYYHQRIPVLKQIFAFLGVDPLGEEELSTMDTEVVNTREENVNRSKEPMLNQTRRLLRDFFMPYNQQLSSLLGDTRFLWMDSPS